MNNLDQAPLILLVARRVAESEEELFASMCSRYDARVGGQDFGPKYKIGPTYFYRGQKFSKICTFAGSLVVRIVFDTKESRFERPVIYRFTPDERLRLLSPGGPESEIEEHGLTEAITNEQNC